MEHTFTNYLRPIFVDRRSNIYVYHPRCWKKLRCKKLPQPMSENNSNIIPGAAVDEDAERVVDEPAAEVVDAEGAFHSILFSCCLIALYFICISMFSVGWIMFAATVCLLVVDRIASIRISISIAHSSFIVVVIGIIIYRGGGGRSGGRSEGRGSSGGGRGRGRRGGDARGNE